MQTNATQSVEIRTARPAEQARALWMVFSDHPPQNRPRLVSLTLQRANKGDQPLDGLAIALRDGHMVGAVWGQVMPGKMATVWLPRLTENEPVDTRRRLMRWSDEHLRHQGIRLAQAIVRTGAEQDAHLVSAVKYYHLADLLYLFSVLDKIQDARVDFPLEFQRYKLSERDRMEKLVEQTYSDSLDCPSLNGVRPTSEVLDGYQQTGTCCTDRWFFVRHQQHDVGCLLLSDHPDDDQWELVYMGLIPTARGQKWGEQITRFGQSLARQAGRSRLVLAVDANNEPAIRVYSRLGFLTLERHMVFLKNIASAD